MKLASRCLAAALVVGSGLMATAPARAEDKIRLLCPTWSGYAPVFVAIDLGIFKKMGLTVDMKFEDERPNVMAAMDKGEIEMDMRTVGEYQGRPRDVSTPGIIIGTIDQSLGGDGVVADGSIKSVAELKGKTIASEPNIPARLLLQLELKKVGMTLKDLTIKDIVTPDTVAVFSDKSIAAVVTYEPFMSQAVKTTAARKPSIILSSKQYPGYITDIVIVRNDDLKKNPNKYKNYMIGIMKAIEYFKTNPADFIAKAAPHYNMSTDDFKDSITGTLDYTDYAKTAALIGKPGSPGELYKIFDTVMALNLENGAADHKLDSAKAIDSSIMALISASDVK